MKATFHIPCVLILLVSTTFASESDWMERYPDTEKSRLFAVLTKESGSGLAELHPRDSIDFVRDNENIAAVQDVLKDTGKTLFDMYSILIKTLYPEFAELSRDYYKEQRDSLGVSNEFNEFDVKFYTKLAVLIELFSRRVLWNTLEDKSSKEDVVCEGAYFYGLIDFERAITCLDAASPTTLSCGIFSNLVADMYFGEALRPDFSYEGDIETGKWLDDMVGKYEGGGLFNTASLMRRFTHNIRGKVDDKLWNDYMRAMMTVHLSAVFLLINMNELKDLHNFIVENDISDEFMFASEEGDPLQPGQTLQNQSLHTFLRTFKFDPSDGTATMGIINSGDGIDFHDYDKFDLSELPDTISKDPYSTSVIRFIPFIVYDRVPRSAWKPACTVVDSMDKAYFELKQTKHEFTDYKKWQYIDDQRAGTCSAMSLWVALYWFERESQQKLESFRLALYLELLKEAAKELIKLRTELEELDTQRSESVGDERQWNELQSKIKEKSEFEDDYFRFFSVGFNSAIRSIRYLHTDPFKQGLDMTSVMQDYAAFYESQGDKSYWQLVKPNIDSLYNSTCIRMLNPTRSLPSVAPKISTKERDCVNEVNQAIKSKSPFNFVRAVISGTDLKCQGKAFLASIHFGVDGLDLQTHHQELILRALAKEIRSLSGGRLSILKLVHKLINDYGFKLFPVYDVPPITKTNFIEESRQVFIFDDDAEMKQFTANCGAFDLLGKNVLAAAYDLVKSTKKAFPDLIKLVPSITTEEYKLHRSLVEGAATELQSIDPHLHAQYLSSLVWNTEETGIGKHIEYFKPSRGWNQDDCAMLENATQGSGPFKMLIRRQLDFLNNLAVGQDSTSKHLPILSNRLKNKEYVCAERVNRAIEKNSPLDFIKEIVSCVDVNCVGELFILFITLGLKVLELQDYHQYLILRTLVWENSLPQIFEFVDELITKGSLKLFSTDNTLPSGIGYTIGKFFTVAEELKDEAEARQLATDLNAKESNASIILKACGKYGELATLKSHFVDHTFKELRSMNPHLHAYHLSSLIRQDNLKPKDFNSVEFRPSTEWNDYVYVLIESAVPSDLRRDEYGKIFNFPKEYHINTENVREESEFSRMSPNPSNETLRDYATMLFNKMKESYRK